MLHWSIHTFPSMCLPLHHSTVFILHIAIIFTVLKRRSIFIFKIEYIAFRNACMFFLVLHNVVLNHLVSFVWRENFKSMWVGNGIATKKMIWSCVLLLSIACDELSPFICMYFCSSLCLLMMHVYIRMWVKRCSTMRLQKCS